MDRPTRVIMFHRLYRKWSGMDGNFENGVSLADVRSELDCELAIDEDDDVVLVWKGDNGDWLVLTRKELTWSDRLAVRKLPLGEIQRINVDRSRLLSVRNPEDVNDFYRSLCELIITTHEDTYVVPYAKGYHVLGLWNVLRLLSIGATEAK